MEAKVDLNPIPHPARGFSLLPTLALGTQLRAWFVPVVAAGGLGLAKAVEPLLSFFKAAQGLPVAEEPPAAAPV